VTQDQQALQEIRVQREQQVQQDLQVIQEVRVQLDQLVHKA
jgi:hypothetical protein